MTQKTARAWEAKRTEETRMVERVLRQAGFKKADAYRYNSASIRVRVIDQQFEGMPTEKRDAMVEPYLRELPERTQADIMNLFTFCAVGASTYAEDTERVLEEHRVRGP